MYKPHSSHPKGSLSAASVREGTPTNRVVVMYIFLHLSLTPHTHNLQAEVDNSSLESEMLASLNTSLVLEAQLFPASSGFVHSAHATANSSSSRPRADYSLLLHNGDLSYAQVSGSRLVECMAQDY